jgi:hypothetical protein
MIREMEELGADPDVIRRLKNLVIILPLLAHGLEIVGAVGTEADLRAAELQLEVLASMLEIGFRGPVEEFEKLPTRVKTARDKLIEGLLGTEDDPGVGLDAFDDAMRGVKEFALGFEDVVSGAFTRIREELASAINPWEEFKVDHRRNGNAIVASFRKQVDALVGFQALVAENAAGMSTETIAQFEAMDLATQASLLHMAEEHPKNWQKFVDGMNEQNDRLSENARQKLEVELPEIGRRAIIDLIRKVEGEVEGLELPAEEAASVFQDLLAEGLALLPEELRPFLQDALDEVTEDELILGSFTKLGDELGFNLMDALALSIQKERWRVEFASRGTARTIDRIFKDEFEITSPSKVAMGWGSDIMQGLAVRPS